MGFGFSSLLPKIRQLQMPMLDHIKKAFPSVVKKELSDDYIRAHTDPMWDTPPIPLIRAIPLYMLWCIEHSSEENELIFDYTISTLNKYARAKTPDIEWQTSDFTVRQSK